MPAGQEGSWQWEELAHHTQLLLAEQRGPDPARAAVTAVAVRAESCVQRASLVVVRGHRIARSQVQLLQQK